MRATTSRRASTLAPPNNELEETLDRAEGLLEQRDKTFDALQRTSSTIAELLARRQGMQADATPGAAAKLSSIQEQIAGQVRLRLSSTERLIGMDAALRDALADVHRVREDYAAAAVAELETGMWQPPPRSKR